ncbi:hypothetical protein ACFX13_039082 [Malus domestica]
MDGGWWTRVRGVCVKAVGFEGLRSRRIEVFARGGVGEGEPRHVDSAVKFQVVRVSAGDGDVATSRIPKRSGPHESRDVAFRILTAAVQTVLCRAAAACSSLPNSKWFEFRLFDTSFQFNGNAWMDALRGIWNWFFTSLSSFGKCRS